MERSVSSFTHDWIQQDFNDEAVICMRCGIKSDIQHMSKEHVGKCVAHYDDIDSEYLNDIH